MGLVDNTMHGLRLTLLQMRSQARWTVRQHIIVPVAVAATFGTMAGFLTTRTQRLKWPLVLGAVSEI
ncbi:hypothetical protein PG996_008148 [Apiospora saccharicola]|uniref:Uncharacterized protein n=1 Tax=Apiospora saccharicola TaxID=335842 RepID=A0ABR1UX29_9PEZI